MKVRIQKYISSQGLLSRRATETALKEGRLSVNGQVVQELGTQIDPEVDKVTLDGKDVKPSLQENITIILNKPKKVVTTKSDPDGKKTVMAFLPEELQFLKPVGRLDFESEGLLLLTSDGLFQQKATHPSFGIIKSYLIQVQGQPAAFHFEQWLTGVNLKDDSGVAIGKFLSVCYADKKLFSQFNWKPNPHHSILEVRVDEGRNRFVRRMTAALGFPVHRLLRFSLKHPQGAEILLGNIPPGQWRKLTSIEQNWVETVKKINLSL